MQNRNVPHFSSLIQPKLHIAIAVTSVAAVGAAIIGNRRDATFPDLGSRTQSRGTFGIFHTLLGQDGFGNVDWQK